MQFASRNQCQGYLALIQSTKSHDSWPSHRGNRLSPMNPLRERGRMVPARSLAQRVSTRPSIIRAKSPLWLPMRRTVFGEEVTVAIGYRLDHSA